MRKSDGRHKKTKHKAMQTLLTTDSKHVAKMASTCSTTDELADNVIKLGLSVGEIFKGRNGQKMAIVSNGHVNLINSVHCPFPAGVYQGDGSERRVNLDVVLSEPDEFVIRRLDRRILEIAKERSVEWFGKTLSEEAIASKYSPMCRLRDGESSRLRTKLNLDSIVVWDHNKTLAVVPECKFAGMDVKCVLRLTSVWFMSNIFGVTVQLTQIQIPEEKDSSKLVCPF